MRERLRPNAKFISLRVAEAEYGIAYSRLRQWVLDGKLPHLDESVTGRRFQIRRTDLEKLLDDNTTTAVR